MPDPATTAAEAAASQMQLELQPNWLLQLPKHLERQFFEESSVQRYDCPFCRTSVLSQSLILQPPGQVRCSMWYN
jgi:hypothetical protein